MLLGVRITLYRAAIVAVQRAEFLAPVAGESRKICVEMANDMARTLRKGNVLTDQIAIYKETSLFVTKPLILAAETFLKDAGPLYEGETRQNFETVSHTAASGHFPSLSSYSIRNRDQNPCFTPGNSAWSSAI